MPKPKWHNETKLLSELIPAKYNPRELTEKQAQDLHQSLDKFGLPEPIVINLNSVIIGGHQRVKLLELQGETEADVRVPDRLLSDEEEVELNLRLNKNTGQWDLDALANTDEELLQIIGFTSEELDEIFELDTTNPEMFDLEKELKKLEIEKIEIQKGDFWQLGEHRLTCGDSTVTEDMARLMQDEKADMCFTDPPYILDYLGKGGKRGHGGATEGFGAKKNRRYLETTEVPPDFTARWMANVAGVSKKDFTIICFENWKNLRTIWGEMEKYWKIRNMIVWHIPNRNQGFASKHRFFSRHDIAMVGTGGVWA